jgi:hypothetical protein
MGGREPPPEEQKMENEKKIHFNMANGDSFTHYCDEDEYNNILDEDTLHKNGTCNAYCPIYDEVLKHDGTIKITKIEFD